MYCFNSRFYFNSERRNATMGEKSWRIKDEQEFLRQANHYLEQHLENFMDNVDTQIVDRKKRKEVWRKFNIYRRNSINSVYVNNIRLKISDMLRIVLEDVKNWIEFSLNKESPLEDQASGRGKGQKGKSLWHI